MSRIAIMLRGFLRWLGRRLPGLIGVVAKPGDEEAPAHRTMAESREQALAAWEHLVSAHAPHLLRKSAGERNREAPMHWPRMKPFDTARQRAWPANAEIPETPSPAHTREHHVSDAPESSRRWVRPHDTQPGNADKKRSSGVATNPQPDAQLPRRNAVPVAEASPVPPDYHPNPAPAAASEDRSWRQPVTTGQDASRARVKTWSTEPAERRTHAADPVAPAPNARAYDRITTPFTGQPASRRGYDPSAPAPATSCRKDRSSAVSEPGTTPHRRSSPWLETPMPEADRPGYEPGAPEAAPAGDPWPELPDGPLWSPTGEPRPVWTEANRRQRLLNEQRGLL